MDKNDISILILLGLLYMLFFFSLTESELERILNTNIEEQIGMFLFIVFVLCIAYVVINIIRTYRHNTNKINEMNMKSYIACDELITQAMIWSNDNIIIEPIDNME